jgi:hypothetical protein
MALALMELSALILSIILMILVITFIAGLIDMFPVVWAESK